ncbi:MULTISPECIES: hypothetical protein [Microbacterium]|uniref:hypothetical protein n=1 Tax=Microbacterium TaxID=33882 RepID=UPI001469EB5E|nr:MULTISPECIES: hypothetical protein [Microbacterium]
MTDVTKEVRRRIDGWLRARRPDADMRADAAVREASRIALFTAVPEMERSHDTVRRGDALRAPARAADNGGRVATRTHEVFFIVALVLGLVVPALVALSPRSGDSALSLDAGTLPAGLCALATLGLFAWLEPYRRSIGLFGHGAPPRLYLVYGIVWLLLVASIVLLRWDEVDEPGSVIVGLVMMVIAAAGTVPLWLRARRSDRPATARPVADEPDMTEWWRGADASLTPQERTDVDRAYRTAIERLREQSVISAAEADAAVRRGAREQWKRAAI